MNLNDWPSQCRVFYYLHVENTCICTKLSLDVYSEFDWSIVDLRSVHATTLTHGLHSCNNVGTKCTFLFCSSLFDLLVCHSTSPSFPSFFSFIMFPPFRCCLSWGELFSIKLSLSIAVDVGLMMLDYLTIDLTPLYSLPGLSVCFDLGLYCCFGAIPQLVTCLFHSCDFLTCDLCGIHVTVELTLIHCLGVWLLMCVFNAVKGDSIIWISRNRMWYVVRGHILQHCNPTNLLNILHWSIPIPRCPTCIQL